MGQSEIDDTVNPDLQNEEQYEKNINQNTYDSSTPGSAIGVATADSDTFVHRSYYKFDVSKVTNANNVQINEVRVYFDTDNNGDYTFKLTGPASISDKNEDESMTEIELEAKEAEKQKRKIKKVRYFIYFSNWCFHVKKIW